jgi:2-oxoisovalerate dehydrogenase E2 component (dihydrolipoyl transacylase)
VTGLVDRGVVLLEGNKRKDSSVNDPWRNQHPRRPPARFDAINANRFRGNSVDRAFSSAVLSDDGTSSVVIPFILADIGEGIAEVELLQWFVQEGDQVNQFDRVCEVQSDKATVEITSRYDGLITSLEHNAGDMVKVGTPLLFIESDDENAVSKNLHTASTQAQPMEDDEKLKIPSIASQYRLSTDSHDEADQIMSALETSTTASNGSKEQGSPRGLTGRASSKVLTSPAIRKLATEYSLDLSTIVGTGPNGRVLKGDVLTVLRERGLMMTPQKNEQSQATPVSSSTAATSSTPKKEMDRNGATITSIDQAVLPLEEDTVMEIRGYNRLMVQSMTASLQIPHMVYADEINVTSLRTQYKSHLPFLPYCIKAASMALSKYPLLNASFDADANRIMLWADHNIGIAMDTPRGLIVPVVKQVQNKSLAEIASELRRLKEFAKDGSVPAEDLQGASFTLSNIGAIGGGGTYMSPIITSPQVAIGALGQVQRVPRFVSENSTEVYEAHIVNVSWGGDHRVVDGATMARFHTQWKEYLQNPICLIQEMK